MTDPATGKPSVSLTLLCIAVVLMIGFTILEAFDALQSSSLLDEFFLTSVSLYFGRRTKFSAGNVDGPSDDTLKTLDQHFDPNRTPDRP